MNAPVTQLKALVEDIFKDIPRLVPCHSREHVAYPIINKVVKTYFSHCDRGVLDCKPFDGINWPYIEMGAISSYDLFSFDEFMLFSYYGLHTKMYKTVFDVGANIGLHSIILSRLGYQVHSFEPDPHHFEMLKAHVEQNKCQNIRLNNAGLSDKSGNLEFVHVKGNTTASHIAGSRPYHGEVEKTKVKVMTFAETGIKPDFMKLDVEGHEKNIITSIPVKEWEKIDAIVEVHSEDNRDAIYDYFKRTKVNLFAQKINWKKISKREDLPVSNKEGNIFISSKNIMPWGN